MLTLSQEQPSLEEESGLPSNCRPSPAAPKYTEASIILSFASREELSKYWTQSETLMRQGRAAMCHICVTAERRSVTFVSHNQCTTERRGVTCVSRKSGERLYLYHTTSAKRSGEVLHLCHTTDAQWIVEM
jgi:hypothetical protein